LNHAMSAVILLQEMMLAKRLDPSSFPDEEEDLPADTSKDRTAVLAIAYHNMGVEQEFLRSYPAAILSYKKAVNFAEKHLGPEDGISQNLRNVFENAKVEVSFDEFDSFSLIMHCTKRVAKRRGRVSRIKAERTMLPSMIICSHQGRISTTWRRLRKRMK